MKKKMIIILAVIFCFLNIMAQDNPESYKDDFVYYYDKMNKHQSLVANNDVESLIGRITNEDKNAVYELVELLQGEYLQSLNTYIEEIKKVNPKTIKMKFLHSEFVEAYQALYLSFDAAKDLDVEQLKKSETEIDVDVPAEYHRFLFGLQVFSIKMNTYDALRNELMFLVQIESKE